MNEEFQLRDGPLSVSDIQDYIEYILKEHEAVTNNPSIMIYIIKNENRITFKIKTGYCLELLTPETMKLLGNTKSKINKDKNGENVPHLEITVVVLIPCNIVKNSYQQDSRVLYTFVPNKSFGQFGFLSFAKNIGKNIGKNISKILSGKYSQKLFDHAKKSATDTFKTASKRAIQKTTEATGDLIGNKIDDKITKPRKIPKKIFQRQLQISMIKKYLKKDIYLLKKDKKIIDNLRSIIIL